MAKSIIKVIEFNGEVELTVESLLQTISQLPSVTLQTLTVSGNSTGTSCLNAFRPLGSLGTVSYVLALSDQNKYIRLTASSNQTVQVPTNSTVAFPIGTEIEFIRTTTNEVEFTAAGGVTLNSVDGNKKLNKQYSAAVLKKIGTNEWDLIGDLKA